MLLLLNALCHRLHIQPLCQMDRLRDNDLRPLDIILPAEETRINLQDIQRQILQRIQRRIPRPEVIHRDQETIRLEPFDRRQHHSLIIKESTLGKLDLDQFMGRPLGTHDFPNLIRKIRLRKVRTRDIHGNRNHLPPLIEPSLLIPGHMRQHIVINLRNKTIVLKNRDKLSRRNKSQIVRDPPDQGLRPHQFIRTRIVLRLIVHLELLVLHRALLPLMHRIDPLLILHDFIIEERDPRLFLPQRHPRRRSIVIKKIDIRIFLHIRRHHIHARLELEIMLRLQPLELLHDRPKAHLRLLLIRRLQQDGKIRHRTMGTRLLLIQVLLDRLKNTPQQDLALFHRVAEHIISIPDKDQIHDRIADLRPSLPQDLAAPHHKPQPVLILRHRIVEHDLLHLPRRPGEPHDIEHQRHKRTCRDEHGDTEENHQEEHVLRGQFKRRLKPDNLASVLHGERRPVRDLVLHIIVEVLKKTLISHDLQNIRRNALPADPKEIRALVRKIQRRVVKDLVVSQDPITNLPYLVEVLLHFRIPDKLRGHLAARAEHLQFPVREEILIALFLTVGQDHFHVAFRLCLLITLCEPDRVFRLAFRLRARHIPDQKFEHDQDESQHQQENQRIRHQRKPHSVFWKFISVFFLCHTIDPSCPFP